jgi:hypothetical protein
LTGILKDDVFQILMSSFSQEVEQQYELTEIPRTVLEGKEGWASILDELKEEERELEDTIDFLTAYNHSKELTLRWIVDNDITVTDEALDAPVYLYGNIVVSDIPFKANFISRETGDETTVILKPGTYYDKGWHALKEGINADPEVIDEDFLAKHKA